MRPPTRRPYRRYNYTTTTQAPARPTSGNITFVLNLPAVPAVAVPNEAPYVYTTTYRTPTTARYSAPATYPSAPAPVPAPYSGPAPIPVPYYGPAPAPYSGPSASSNSGGSAPTSSSGPILLPPLPPLPSIPLPPLPSPPSLSDLANAVQSVLPPLPFPRN